MTAIARDLDTLCVNTLRGLCMDAIERAGPGHPGIPLGMARVACTLRQRYLRFDPGGPIWPRKSLGHTGD
jgi:transketolase